MMDKITKQSSRFYLLTGTSFAFGVISACLLVPTLWASKLELVKVADLEAGKAPTSNWVVIDDGKLLWNDSFQMIERFSRKYIVPVVSPDWKPGQPVAVFAVMPVDKGNAMGDYETIQGICRLTGLDRQIKQQIDGHVEFQAAETHIMIQHGTDPGMDRNLGLVLCGVCFLMAVGAVFLYNDNPKPNREPVAVTRESAERPDSTASDPQPVESVAEVATATSSSADPASGDVKPDEVTDWLRGRGIEL